MLKKTIGRCFKVIIYTLAVLWTLVIVDVFRRNNTVMQSEPCTVASTLGISLKEWKNDEDSNKRKVETGETKVIQRILKDSPTEDARKKINQDAKVSANQKPNGVIEHKPPSKRKLQTNPIILVWKTSHFLWSKRDKVLEYVTDEACGSCRITADRSKLKESIAVILFNHNDLLTTIDVPDPKTRSPDQVYVFWSIEPPSKSIFFKDSLKHPKFDSIFNLTMTYESRSDIRKYFGTHRLALEKSKRRGYTSSSVLKQKKKLAIWVVSNCGKMIGTVERTMYAKSLVEAGLKLDKFGTCFDGERQNFALTVIVKEYKFYLAFENSVHCPEYITEKFWRNSLSSGAVPVVWGPTKKDVKAVAPPHSFIHAEDFKKPKDLVKYLNYLNKNNTAYMEYHKWRDVPLKSVPPDDFADRSELGQFCRLCRRQVLEHHPSKSIPSIYEWFYETGYPDDKCLRNFTTMSDEEKNKLTSFR